MLVLNYEKHLNTPSILWPRGITVTLINIVQSYSFPLLLGPLEGPLVDLLVFKQHVMEHSFYISQYYTSASYNSICWHGFTVSILNHITYIFPFIFFSIRLLSEALDNLLRDVNSLKKRIRELNDRLDSINRAFIKKRLRMAPRNPASIPKNLNGFPKLQVKLTHPPNRPFSVKRRVYIRRRVKAQHMSQP